MIHPKSTAFVDTDHQVMRQPIDIDFVSKAIIGIASPVMGVITSYQEQIEWHLRVASLCVGLAVGILSLVSMAKKLRRK
jgi:hypothetical protein